MMRNGKIKNIIKLFVLIIIVLFVSGTIVWRIKNTEEKKQMIILYMNLSQADLMIIDGVNIYTDNQFQRSDFKWPTSLAFKVDGIMCLRDTKSINEPEDAISLARNILAEYHAKGLYKTLGLYSIIHLSKDNTWHFEYIDFETLGSEGGSMIIAINGDDCKVIRAWIAE